MRSISVKLSEYEQVRLRGAMLLTQESASEFVRKALAAYLPARLEPGLSVNDERTER